MTKVRNVSTHVVDTTPDGRVIAPGDFAEVDLNEDHNKLLLQDGALLQAEEAPESRSAPQVQQNQKEEK